MTSTTIPYQLTRLHTLMSPEDGNAFEAQGVLNPATAWGTDGELYLYPRLVAAGNVSRIGKARVLIEDGVPVGVERQGFALEPVRGWEHGATHGGVEDPRSTWLPALRTHVMTYVAFGPLGPKPALAVSVDGQSWRRLGPICFEYADELNTDLNLFPNKDVVVFPEVVPDPDGHPSYAILHRPMWDLSFARPGEPAPLPAGIEDARAGIWISYVDADAAVADLRAFARPHSHRWLAGPSKPWEALKIGAGPTPGPNNPENYSVAPWEDLKIGAGPAPLRVPEGWLLIYHGVTGRINGLGSFVPQDGVHYVAAAMILDPADPSRVLARTSTPLLEPATESETSGAVPNVVFPTAIEKIGSTHYVFYGMADSMIGVARLDRTDTTA